MDKNTITGFILIVLIMIGSYFFLRGPADQAKKEAARQDSIKMAAAAKKSTVPIAKADTIKKTAVTDSDLAKIPFGVATVGSEKLVHRLFDIWQMPPSDPSL